MDELGNAVFQYLMSPECAAELRRRITNRLRKLHGNEESKRTRTRARESASKRQTATR